MKKCTSILGHKFEGRYNSEPSHNFEGYEGPVFALVRLVEASTKKTYVLDVCTRCGQTIERIRHD